jgi:hypothetical protein
MNESLRQALTTPPSTREKIVAWVKYFLNFDVHQTVRCTHIEGDEPHSCQLDYIEEAFLHRYSSCVVMAARNAGKSYAAAISCLLDCWFKPCVKIAVAAFQRNQSDYIYTYLIAFLDVFEVKCGVKVVKRSKGHVGKDVIEFLNGSSVAFFSGGKSQAGIKGYHPNILIVDECDLFSQEQFDGIANALEAGGKFQRRLDILSTNYRVDGGDGVVLKQIERYQEFNKTLNPHMLPCAIFKICLLDILEKCDDRFQCYDEINKRHCALWTYCKGKAKDGDGHYKVTSAFETMRDSSRQTFEAQMLLLRPSSEFAYFHNFDVVKNVNDPDRELDPTMLSFTIWDFGGVHCPHACLVVQKSADGIYYVVDEFFAMGALDGLINKVLTRYPNARDFDCFADPKGTDVQQIKGGVSYTGLLKKNLFWPQTKRLKREPTFQILFNLIDPATGPKRLMVNKRCKTLLKQIYAAECKTTKSGRPTTEPADNGNDDALDCLRYCVGSTSGTYAKHNGSKRLRWF